ncbi:serine O-acetyltransferase [Arthrobacter sp. B6]|uniref:serine O-acetyltransferase n=1 Tax=Arthrobacter sp. B6 TaxID=1570137 RepID=UPI003FA4D23E
MSAVSAVVANWKLDSRFHYQNSGRSVPSGLKFIVTLVNPSLVAVSLFRISANSSGVLHVFCRWLTLSLFSSDVSTGVTFEGAVECPHPTGIVLGRSVRIGADARIFQNVTLGSSRNGDYPVIGRNVTIYSGAVVAGNLTIGDDAVVGANCVVTKSVSTSEVVRFG